jgi:hypothetical protein
MPFGILWVAHKIMTVVKKRELLMKTKTIKINSLLLNLDNSRFPETPESQREAIIQMVNIQGDRIVSLARDIIENGLDPSENIIVHKGSDGKSVVMEGNRRLTTLKLLNQPDLIPANNTTNKIKKILQTNPDIPDSLSCVVFGDESEFEHWINLKHTGANNGAGRVNWTGQEVDRHKAKHGNTSYGNQLLTFINKEAAIPDSIKTNTQKLYITNINRLLDDPSVRELLSLSAVSGELYCYQSKESFISDMNKVLTCMLEVDEKGKVQFTVNRIKAKRDRAVFLSQLDIAGPSARLDKPWKVTEPNPFKTAKGVIAQAGGVTVEEPKTTESSEASPKDGGANDSKKTETKYDGDSNQVEPSKDKVKKSANAYPNRNMLIPANVVLTILDKKCNGVFKELKNKLKYDEQPHSIAVMFRVFLELSLINYLTQKGITLDGRKSGLHDKVVAVSNALKGEGKISGAQCTAIQVTSSNISKGSGELQNYLHNSHLFPDKVSINTNWDNLESLFVGIWS